MTPEELTRILTETSIGKQALNAAIEATIAAIDQRVTRMPEDAATASMDFGRGYGKAIADVRALLRTMLP